MLYISKLSDPRSYFNLELDRFVIQDIIGLADLCDEKIPKTPKQNSQLETTLSTLFERAGLKNILPNVGEKFDPSQHVCVEMVNGYSGNSGKITEIVIRGVIRTDGDKEKSSVKPG